VLAPTSRRHLFEAAEDAIKMLHAAEAGLKSDFRTSVIRMLEQIAGAGDASAHYEFDDAASDFPLEEPHQRPRGDVGGARDRGQREPFCKMRLDERDRAAKLRLHPSGFSPKPALISLGQAVANELQQVEQILLPFRCEDAVLLEQLAQRPGVKARFDQALAGAAPFGFGRSAIVHLPTLKQRDDFAVPNYGDQELGQPGVAAITQNLLTATSLEESGLVAHGAKGVPSGGLLQGEAKRLCALFHFIHDDAFPVRGNQRQIDAKKPPRQIEHIAQARHSLEVIKGVHRKKLGAGQAACKSDAQGMRNSSDQPPRNTGQLCCYRHFRDPNRSNSVR
jgi:hypothetical protein